MACRFDIAHRPYVISVHLLIPSHCHGSRVWDAWWAQCHYCCVGYWREIWHQILACKQVDDFAVEPHVSFMLESLLQIDGCKHACHVPRKRLIQRPGSHGWKTSWGFRGLLHAGGCQGYVAERSCHCWETRLWWYAENPPSQRGLECVPGHDLGVADLWPWEAPDL